MDARRPLIDKYVSKRDLAFAEEKVLADVAMVLGKAIEKLNMRPKEVAEKLGVSKCRIAQLLSAGENTTLQNIARVVAASGLELRIECAKRIIDEELPPSS